MKLFHLSDLHLGKRLKDFSLYEDHKYILKEILTLINEEAPDAILVAGDVYDRNIPSEEAMKLWDDFLISLSKKGIPVYAINGNHDSAIRFSDHGQLVEIAGIHLSPVYDGSVSKYTLEDDNGPVNIYLLPFIKPATVRPLFPDEEINDYTDALRVAIDHMDVEESQRNILVAHQFVTGGSRCESEDIVVGGLDNVDASVFDSFDYVALGHLHGAQSIGRDTLRYCGTPIKYSLSERDHVKSITVVELREKGSVTVSEIPLKPRHDLRQIRGTYEELTTKKNYEGTDTDDYIHAVLTDEDDIVDAAGKLRVIYPNLMSLDYDNKRTRRTQSVTDVSEVEKKTPLELFSEFFEKRNNAPMTEEQKEYIIGCIESIWEGK